MEARFRSIGSLIPSKTPVKNFELKDDFTTLAQTTQQKLSSLAKAHVSAAISFIPCDTRDRITRERSTQEQFLDKETNQERQTEGQTS